MWFVRPPDLMAESDYPDWGGYFFYCSGMGKGGGEIINIFISPEIMTEPKEILEDLIIAAHKNEKDSLNQKTSDEISKLTEGLGIPGFKWPM